VTGAERRRFDAMVERVIAALPPAFADFIERTPVIVLDEPTEAMLDDLERAEGSRPAPDELCGLHTGVADTQRSLEASGVLPSEIHLFRLGIVSMAGGWEAEDADARIEEEIEVTLLHEIGHQLGLDEDDLDELGYG